MSDNALGTVSRNGDTFDIVFERRIAKPIEKVWAALTVPERIADWLGIVDLDPRLGGHYLLKFSADDPGMVGEVVEFQPLRLLAHTWPDPGHPDGIVRYELEPDGAGCRLRLTNAGLLGKYARSIAGWHVFLDAIPGATEGVATVWTMAREAEVLALYQAQLTAVGAA